MNQDSPERLLPNCPEFITEKYVKEAPWSAASEEGARGNESKNPGVLGGLKWPAQNPRSEGVPSWPAVSMGQDQHVGNSIIPSSPYAEQETPQGKCQCQSDQNPDCNAKDGPHRETYGASCI